MSGNELTLRNAIAEYVEKSDGPFKLEQLVNHVRKLFPKPPRALPSEVQSALRKEPLTFHHGELDYYIPRRLYFRGAQFRVTPRAQEIQAGLLFPGHRLMPFCRRDVLPADCRIGSPRQEPLQTRKSSWRLRDAISIHSLFGWRNMLNYFVADHEENAVALAEADPDAQALLTLTALDLDRHYREWNFKEGDSLILTVQDWDRGEFQMRHHPAAKPSVDRAALEKQWCSILEDALDEVFEESGIMLDVYEQLSLAFYYGGKFLTENPVIHIGGFLAKSRRIELAQMASQTLLWRRGESPTSWVFPDLALTRRPATGVTDSLDAMLQDLGVSLRKSDIEAYMRDEICCGGGSLGAALQRSLRWRGELNFFNNRQRLAFSHQIESLWVETSKTARSGQEEINRLRGRALRIMDAKLEWLRKLDSKGVSVYELPSAEFLTLSDSMSMLSSILEELNSGDVQESEDTRELGGALEEIEAASRKLMDAAEARIEVFRLGNSFLPDQ